MRTLVRTHREIHTRNPHACKTHTLPRADPSIVTSRHNIVEDGRHNRTFYVHVAERTKAVPRASSSKLEDGGRPRHYAESLPSRIITRLTSFHALFDQLSQSKKHATLPPCEERKALPIVHPSSDTYPVTMPLSRSVPPQRNLSMTHTRAKDSDPRPILAHQTSMPETISPTGHPKLLEEHVRVRLESSQRAVHDAGAVMIARAAPCLLERCNQGHAGGVLRELHPASTYREQLASGKNAPTLALHPCMVQGRIATTTCSDRITPTVDRDHTQQTLNTGRNAPARHRPMFIGGSSSFVHPPGPVEYRSIAAYDRPAPGQGLEDKSPSPGRADEPARRSIRGR